MTIFRHATFAAATFAVFAIGSVAQAATIRSGFDASTLAGNDDGSDGPVAIGFDIDFFGVTANQLFVNNNGNVTLDSSLSIFTPFDLTSTGQQIIAPFFADVDTRTAGSEVTYGTGTVDGRAAFGVNWVDVGYFSSQTDLSQLNDFQLVLIERFDTGAGNFDIEFNYGDILWETGNASSGSGGLGGDSARVGFSNGTGDAGTFFELEGSAVNGAFLNGGTNALNVGSNIGEAGRFLFTARGSTVVQPPVVQPPVGVVPLPASGLLLLGGLGGVALLRRRKRAS